MLAIELRDPDEARDYLLEGLWWQRLAPPSVESMRRVLEWAREIAAAGQPLPPVGFVSDLGHVALGLGDERRTHDLPVLPGLPTRLLRAVDEAVLGRLIADWSLARAGDVARRCEGRDRARTLAFVLDRFRARAGLPGVYLSPGIVSSVLALAPEDALARGWGLLERDGADALLVRLYEALVDAVRRTAEVLDDDDLAELENGTALEDEGPQLARRQVRQAAALLSAALPRQRPRPSSRRLDVPTRILDEDTYPVGGYNSLATRGSVESLLHSQLAYMEPHDRPDLFDVKFLRDELLYYARDENQFLRQRRTVVVALYPDLATTRFKDRELGFQRGVLLLALLTVALRRLVEWLADAALSIEVIVVENGTASPLAPERRLLETLVPDLLSGKLLHTQSLTEKALRAACTRWAARSRCNCLIVAASPRLLRMEGVAVSRLQIDGPRPMLAEVDDEPKPIEADDALAAWAGALDALLRTWV